MALPSGSPRGAAKCRPPAGAAPIPRSALPTRALLAGLLAGLLAALPAGPASARPPSAAPGDRVVPAVRALLITGNGLRGEDVSGDETAASCARFRLRPRDVRAFFLRAQRVDARAYSHDLEMSRCHAEGRVTFADGRRGRWRIDRERRGLVIPEGGGERILLYCPRCTTRAFEPVYDPDRDG